MAHTHPSKWLAAVSAPAQDWARPRLEKSPRHPIGGYRPMSSSPVILGTASHTRAAEPKARTKRVAADETTDGSAKAVITYR
jgi:hypothetical protein